MKAKDILKERDLFNRPTINLTSFASVDVSKFLHADEARGEHTWTFTGPDASWTTSQTGWFNEAARKAVAAYCHAYQTKYCRIILVSMEPIEGEGLSAPVYNG